MSLRMASGSLRSLRSLPSAQRTFCFPVRHLRTSAPHQAGSSDHHHDSHHSSAEDRQYETRESWFIGPSRNFIIGSLIAYFGWDYLPEASKVAASPYNDPEAFNAMLKDESIPWYTRWIAKHYASREEVLAARDEMIREDAHRITNRFAMWDMKGSALGAVRSSGTTQIGIE
ncbi:hypothetical protein BD324DRAFT_612502 [Kockovaella imperatae]|uniref:Uncharacterized protein n=1 Tax=Kockovaella imperatae TaxID=4999 RepID=A0A1Y1US95_9TREE|nr:hypothetical protein BD324DRAFT_612502 [Kockovaella imperatae]ORX40898.1 hypothetical protein BD324DRAFT_612502 [Kockovaella imperatae]